MGGISRGRPWNNTDPYDDGAKTPLCILSQWYMGEEVGRVDRWPVDLPSLDQVMNLGMDSIPDTIEWGVKDSMKWLGGKRGMSADRLRKGGHEQVWLVDEVWVVTIPSDAIIIQCFLILIWVVQYITCVDSCLCARKWWSWTKDDGETESSLLMYNLICILYYSIT